MATAIATIEPTKLIETLGSFASISNLPDVQIGLKIPPVPDLERAKSDIEAMLSLSLSEEEAHALIKNKWVASIKSNWLRSSESDAEKYVACYTKILITCPAFAARKAFECWGTKFFPTPDELIALITKIIARYKDNINLLKLAITRRTNFDQHKKAVKNRNRSLTVQKAGSETLKPNINHDHFAKQTNDCR